MFAFEELTQSTREYMLHELDHDVSSGTLYFSRFLSDTGKLCYEKHLRSAIETGTEQDLVESLSPPEYWNADAVTNANVQLGESEFNCFYIRGLCSKMLIEDGGGNVQQYRAKQRKTQRKDNQVKEDDEFPCEVVLKDLRNRENGKSIMGFCKPYSGRSFRRLIID